MIIDSRIANAKIGNKKITISYDELQDDPRQFSESLGTMACFHKRYDIGDPTHRDENPLEFQEWVTTNKEIAKYFPIYLYDHSGLTIRTYPFECRWDSGLLGYIYVTKERVRKEYGVKRISPQLLDKVSKVLLAEIEEMDYYLRGEVYCIDLEEDEEVIDSICGIYGYDNLKDYLNTEVSKEFQPLLEQLDL
ncbi:MAG: hypothetical protein WC942_08995 [Clostridia bacterium]|jgi:hypothetical protein